MSKEKIKEKLTAAKIWIKDYLKIWLNVLAVFVTVDVFKRLFNALFRKGL